MDAHAPFDAPVESIFFVERKSWPLRRRRRMIAFFQGALRLVFQRLSGRGAQAACVSDRRESSGGRPRCDNVRLPESIALRGMPAKLGVAGSCTSTTPLFP